MLVQRSDAKRFKKVKIMDKFIIEEKKWTYKGYDFVAYKTKDNDNSPDDFPGEFEDEDIQSFKEGKWYFAQVTVVCSLFGIQLGYSFIDCVPDGFGPDGEINEAFDIIKEFEMHKEALMEAILIAEVMSSQTV